MIQRLAEGPGEQDEASEDGSGEKDEEDQIQYENDGPDGCQTTECMGGNGE